MEPEWQFPKMQESLAVWNLWGHQLRWGFSEDTGGFCQGAIMAKQRVNVRSAGDKRLHNKKEMKRGWGRGAVEESFLIYFHLRMVECWAHLLPDRKPMTKSADLQVGKARSWKKQKWQMTSSALSSLLRAAAAVSKVYPGILKPCNNSKNANSLNSDPNFQR